MRPEAHERLVGILASYRTRSLRQRAEIDGLGEQVVRVHEMGDIYSFEIKPTLESISEELKRHSYDMSYSEDVDWNNGLLVIDVVMGIGTPPDGTRDDVPGLRFTMSAHKGDVTVEAFESGFSRDGRTRATLRFDQIDRERVANMVLDLLERVCEVQLAEEKGYLIEKQGKPPAAPAPEKSLEFSVDEAKAETRIAKFRSRTRRS